MMLSSLRQLTKQLSVSASYLSQVKNGKRPASGKVLSNPDVKQLLNVKQHEVDTRMSTSYNKRVLGNSLAVGQRTLDPPGKVRILLPQPFGNYISLS